jgi:hypothetical protein
MDVRGHLADPQGATGNALAVAAQFPDTVGLETRAALEVGMTGRERVTRALEFQRPDRAPRDLWALGAGVIPGRQQE